MTRHPIATRCGQPAHLNPPPMRKAAVPMRQWLTQRGIVPASVSAMGMIMLAEEARHGRMPIYPHNAPSWLIAEDWSPWPVLSTTDTELHIIAVASARKGALTRLIKRAGRAGLAPVIVCPIGQEMPAILKHWGWECTLVGTGLDQRDEWRPAAKELAA